MATTAADVRVIISTPLTDAQIDALIVDATLMASPCLDSLDAAVADAIVKYLTADLIASTVSTKGAGTITSKKLGDAAESYGTSQGAGLQGAQFGKSAYWQRAVMLDPNGCLARKTGKFATFERV